MKNLLFFVLLITSFIGCKKAKEPTPFVGHWQSDAVAFKFYDAAGNYDSTSAPIASTIAIDVTPTNISYVTQSGSNSLPVPYTLVGESLTTTAPTIFGNEATIRNLTSSGFTWEIKGSGPGNGTAVNIRTFHH